MEIEALLNLAMTSNNYTDSDGNTFVASASSVFDSTRVAYMPFNGTNATGENDCWHPTSGAPQWIMLQLPEPICIKGFTMKNRSTNIECPNTVIFQGSDNGTDFTDICEFVFSSSATKNVVKEVAFENTKGYTYYRWYISSVNASYGVIAKIIITDAKFVTTKKYLINSEGVYYNVTDGALTPVDISELNSSAFLTYGNDESPVSDLLITLSSPKIMCWTDADKLPTLTATVTATPPPQVITSGEIDLMDATIKGIRSVAVDCNGDPVFAISFDKKATWMMHNGTEWLEVTDDNSGMTKAEFEAITTEQWQPQYEISSDMYIRCTLLDATQSMTAVHIDFVN